MRRLIDSLRALRENRQGSMPPQYAMVVALTALATTAIAQTVTSKVADKLNAVTTALNKVQF
jgi:hypothetical protein